MSEENKITEDKDLSDIEMKWLRDQEMQIIGYGTNVWRRHDGKNKQKKVEWIEKKYNALEEIGFTLDTIYKKIRQKVDSCEIQISDSYIRYCIRRMSDFDLSYGARYYHNDSIYPRVVRQARIKYIESGQYFLDEISGLIELNKILKGKKPMAITR